MSTIAGSLFGWATSNTKQAQTTSTKSTPTPQSPMRKRDRKEKREEKDASLIWSFDERIVEPVGNVAQKPSETSVAKKRRVTRSSANIEEKTVKEVQVKDSHNLVNQTHDAQEVIDSVKKCHGYAPYRRRTRKFEQTPKEARTDDKNGLEHHLALPGYLVTDRLGFDDEDPEVFEDLAKIYSGPLIPEQEILETLRHQNINQESQKTSENMKLLMRLLIERGDIRNSIREWRDRYEARHKASVGAKEVQPQKKA